MLKQSPFTFRDSFTTLASWVSYFAVIWAGYLLITQQVDPLWLVVTLVGGFCLIMGATVGLHRYFSHGSFSCNRFWEIVLAYWATLGIYGSTVQWAALHTQHHKHSDSSSDPIIAHWTYLFWQRNRNQDLDLRTLVRLWKNSVNRFFHNYYLLVVLSTALVFYLISPWLVLFGYLLPLAWYHFVTSLHTFLSHCTGQPRNLEWLELPFFTGGEWAHARHHQNMRASQISSFDIGYYFIRLIQK